ncbi:MAG TPA: YetF domain-containing protein [Roseiflexaceae bacterium]|nr:YetF domain-containing protein [Roseiflexaceae bacterium]
MFDLDWGRILLPSTPPLEIFVRGTLMYLALFVMLRVVLRRQSGTVGITDLLVVVLLADASQNALAGDYHSVADGVLLVATIIGWSYALDWLGYHIPAVQRFVHPPPLTLVKDGQMQRRNMRHELITPEELMTQLREQGIESLDQVKRACIEGDGQISVVKREETGGAEQGKKRRAAI